jgi:hypothetical protein
VLGLTAMASDVLADARTGKNGRHALAGLFRQSIFGRLAGYERWKIRTCTRSDAINSTTARSHDEDMVLSPGRSQDRRQLIAMALDFPPRRPTISHKN